MKKILGVSVGVVVVGMVGVVAFVFSGAYNVSATEKHWDITTKIMEIARDRSVHAASHGIVVPDLDDEEMIARGAKNYDSMCVQCHLAPGAQDTELHQALYPKPPIFHKKTDEHKHGSAETFWVIKHGLKMTGMPAWGEFHTDQQLWEMTAYLEKSQGMSAKTYKDLVGDGGHSHSEKVHYEPSTGKNKMKMNKHGDSDDAHSDTDNHGH